MKKILALAFCLIAIADFSFSQDVITKTSGEEIKVKVLEVLQAEVKYKRHDQIDGPTFTILKSDIFMIKYQNGSKEVFTDEEKTRNSLDKTEELTQKGKEDAKVHYKGRNSGAGWTAATSIVFSPLIGLIPAAIVTSSEPSDENLNSPNSTLMKNNAYNKAYTDQAYKTKKKKVWKSYGIGSAAWFLLIFLLGGV